MLIPKPVRERSAGHLARVRQMSCSVPGCCAAGPVQAHHLTIAQPKARGLKASDACAVPLCHQHHDALHRRGDERAWWDAVGVDPIALAESLWRETVTGRDMP
jgi:hypothetical protein